MTAATAAAPVPQNRLRIAITSPDILARIRQVFASRNLDVEFVGLPFVEILVSQAANVPAANIVASGPRGLRGPASRPEGTAVRRMSAEYRLSVVPAAAPRTRPELPAPPRRPRALPSRADGYEDRVAALSKRQREVMALVSNGVRNAEIAVLLNLTEKTVKNHINRIFRTLRAGSRVEAVLIWQRHRRAAAAARAGAASAPAAGRPAASGGTPSPR